MLDIRHLRQQYESIIQMKQSTPKKCFTPKAMGQQSKFSPDVYLTPKSSYTSNKAKKICNNCINKHLMDEKQSRILKEKQDDQKLYQQLRIQMDSENQYRDQVAEEYKRRQLTLNKINGEMINLHHERSKTEHVTEQKEVAKFFRQLKLEEKHQEIIQKEKKEYLSQYYLRDLKNQIEFKEEEKKQQRLLNNKSDSLESQYWTHFEHEQIQQQKIKAQQQRQMINYWKNSELEKQKLKHQQDEINKIEKEQMELIYKSNENMLKANQLAKKQQIEIFKKEIEDQKQYNDQQKRKQYLEKQSDHFLLMQRKQIEDQYDKVKKLDKELEKQNFIKDIQIQLNHKNKIQQEMKERDIKESENKLLIKDPPQKLERCDECKHPSKIITNIIQ